MQTFLKGKRVGYWLSEKKIKKLNFQAFAELCSQTRSGCVPSCPPIGLPLSSPEHPGSSRHLLFVAFPEMSRRGLGEVKK
ncbi:Inositol-tetrakisphosphate 1-kinase [Tupaia chinensis]|uniref:Inositol-tetrakisphosphate 1-kinase n=1 Tax=Tupaia chinensis TaxID=246437 RepID=L9JZK7_TUPCH|nr:Inositol-tetrakisphosphate 1-kinase [Tupaia chinensis]